jgi:site-specific DNA-methyltransferase (adenine-specific)
MKPTLTIGNATIYAGNNLEVLPTLADNSVDSIVCDPPYELGFMGKTWDSSGIAYSVELWRECLRVLKPGGHLLAFGGTRTWHRLAVAIEDAGFEIRDNIAWLYGSGFPKSHNISKAIDKLHGAERTIIGRNPNSRENATKDNTLYESGTVGKTDFITEATTDDAKAWDGWGTALKPAHEPIVVARKPVIGTVAQNVLEHGVGGINVDACRIGFAEDDKPSAGNRTATFGTQETQSGGDGSGGYEANNVGRWPANIILDEHTAKLLDKQSGVTKTGDVKPHENNSQSSIFGNGKNLDWKGVTGFHKGDTGGASRFFYVAKANKRDRNEGLENIEGQEISAKGNGLARTCNTCGASTLDGCDCPDRTFSNPVRQNFHPTVKPTALMQYLIRLVTPDNGVVLDPFAGSGSTGKAAILEGKHFIGIEITPEYLPIIEGRLQHAYETINNKEDLF